VSTQVDTRQNALQVRPRSLYARIAPNDKYTQARLAWSFLGVKVLSVVIGVRVSEGPGLLAVKMYETGKLNSGLAARLAGVPVIANNIPLAPVLATLQDAGLYLDRDLVSRVLQLAGEA